MTCLLKILIKLYIDLGQKKNFPHFFVYLNIARCIRDFIVRRTAALIKLGVSGRKVANNATGECKVNVLENSLQLIFSIIHGAVVALVVGYFVVGMKDARYQTMANARSGVVFNKRIDVKNG